MKKLYLFILTGLIFTACVNIEEPQATDDAPQKIMTRSAVEKDPYKLSLIQEVLDRHLATTRAARIVLEPTHLYVRFLPQDSLQVAAIYALGLDTFYRPIGEEDVEINEPEVDDDDEQTFCPIHAVVPANFVFPQGITHEIIYESFIQSMDGQTAASGEQLPTDLYRSILNETLAMAGSGAAARAGTSQEWKPSARFRLEVEINATNSKLVDTISLPKLNVVVFQGSRREVLRTNSNGETGEYGKFVGSVGFQLNWDDDNFIIWENNNDKRRQSYINDNTAPLDFVFTGRSLDVVCAALYRAMHAYCYENYNSLNGLIRERRFFDVGLKHKEAGSWSGRYIWGLRRPMALYAISGGRYKTSREIMATAFHELGHASQNYKNNADYVWAFTWNRKKMESWAEGISYAFMTALFLRYEASLGAGWASTSLMECLLKNGLTLEQIQYDFFSTQKWEQWRDRIKERTDKPISSDLVHEIFAFPNMYRFDTRDMLESNVAEDKLYINQPVMLTLKPGCDSSVEKWEVASGSGVKVLKNSNIEYCILFRNPGNKLIRATIVLPSGIRVTQEKNIQVVNENMLKLSPVIAVGQELTVSLRSFSSYPISKVNRWWADVTGMDNVEIRRIGPKSATYNFKKLAATRKVIAEVEYSDKIFTFKDTCSVDVKLGTEMIANPFKIIRPVGGFLYGEEYAAVYIGNGRLMDSNKVNASIKHYYNLIDIWDFASYCRIADNTLYFRIPPQNMTMDFILKFNNVSANFLYISNYRDAQGNLN